MAVHKWFCFHGTCEAEAYGVGDAIAVIALGWQCVDMENREYPILLCPSHREDVPPLPDAVIGKTFARELSERHADAIAFPIQQVVQQLANGVKVIPMT